MAQAQSRTINTDAGPLHLNPVAIDELREVARYWPMDLVATPQVPGTFGLVFQRGGHELHGMKMQPADAAESDAQAFHHMNRALIAAALPRYLERGHQGVMVPCAYYKAKSSGQAETGFAFFVGPDVSSKAESTDRSDSMYDDRLGEGATPMIFDMAAAIAQASKECGLPMMPVIGAQLSPRLALGGLAMHVLVVGARVFVVKDSLNEAEPVWRYLVQAGYSTLPYAPMTPAALPEAPSADSSSG